MASEDLVIVAFCAGLGTRLHPITLERAKVMCPVGNRTLLDRALERCEAVGGRVAINVHAFADEVVAAADGRAHVSDERGGLLGTAGALAHMREFLDGRSVLAINADTYCDADLAAVAHAWDGERPLVASNAARFGPGVGVVASITPWALIKDLSDGFAGLYTAVWSRAATEGTLQELAVECTLIDCGRPRDLLAANLEASGGASVIDPTAVVAPGAEVRASVVFGGGIVSRDELLDRAIRTDHGRTVWCR